MSSGTQRSLPGRCLVQRALVAANCHVLVGHDGFEPDAREWNDGHSRLRVLDKLLASVPSSTLQEQAVDVDSILRHFKHVFWSEWLDVGLELEGVDRSLSLSSVGLKRSCHETLREEEGREPVGVRITAAVPLLHEDKSRNQVVVPGGERLERRVAKRSFPLRRNFVVLEPLRHNLELTGHHGQTRDGVDKLLKLSSNDGS